MSILLSNLEKLSKAELIEKLKFYNEEKKGLQYLIDSIHGIAWEFDLNSNRFTCISSGAKRILGYEIEEWSDFDSWKKMIHPEDREQIASYCTTQTQDGKDHTMEYRMLTKTGETIWVLDVVALTKDGTDKASILHGFILDITDKKILELKSQKEHKFLQNIIDTVPDPIMVINADYSVNIMNKRRREDLRGRTFKDPSSPKCYEISHFRDTPCDGAEHNCPLEYVLKNKTATKVLHNHKTKNGANQYVELAASPLFDDDKNCIGIIESARDITAHIELTHKLQEQKELLYHNANHDHLTNLPNRALFRDRLEQSIKYAKRQNTTLALFFIDLDHFKEVNDTFGHSTGDAVLIEASRRLKSCIRESDVLSRLGGDEFTIIMKDIQSHEDASILAEKIIYAFKEPMLIDDNSIKLSTSIGICVFPDKSDLLGTDDISEKILQSSDKAMYKAKENGKNNFQFYNSIKI